MLFSASFPEAATVILSKADASKRIDELRERSPRLSQE
jgi:hypothetical protein